MENARVAVIEDDDFFHARAIEAVEGAGHSVVAAAKDMETARGIARGIVGGDIEVDLVVLDGNIGPYSRCAHAREIMNILGFPEQPATKVVGFSGDNFFNMGLNPDANLGKDPRAVVAYLADL